MTITVHVIIYLAALSCAYISGSADISADHPLPGQSIPDVTLTVRLSPSKLYNFKVNVPIVLSALS